MFRDTIKIVVAEMKTFSSRCIHKQQPCFQSVVWLGEEHVLPQASSLTIFDRLDAASSSVCYVQWL